MLFAILPVVRKPIFPWPVVFQLWIIVKRKKNVSVRCVLSLACLFVLSCLFIYVINQQFLECFDEDKNGGGEEKGEERKNRLQRVENRVVTFSWRQICVWEKEGGERERQCLAIN